MLDWYLGPHRGRLPWVAPIIFGRQTSNGITLPLRAPHGAIPTSPRDIRLVRYKERVKPARPSAPPPRTRRVTYLLSASKAMALISGTDLIHTDDRYRVNEVAPLISVSTCELVWLPPFKRTTLTCALPLVQPSGFLLGQAYQSMVASTLSFIGILGTPKR